MAPATDSTGEKSKISNAMLGVKTVKRKKRRRITMPRMTNRKKRCSISSTINRVLSDRVFSDSDDDSKAHEVSIENLSRSNLDNSDANDDATSNQSESDILEEKFSISDNFTSENARLKINVCRKGRKSALITSWKSGRKRTSTTDKCLPRSKEDSEEKLLSDNCLITASNSDSDSKTFPRTTKLNRVQQNIEPQSRLDAFIYNETLHKVQKKNQGITVMYSNKNGKSIKQPIHIHPKSNSFERIKSGETDFYKVGNLVGDENVVCGLLMLLEKKKMEFAGVVGESVLLYVMTGILKVRIGEHSFEAIPGSAMFVPENLSYEIQNLSDHAARLTYTTLRS